MTLVSKGFLAALVTTLGSILIFLGAYNGNVTVSPHEEAFAAVVGPDSFFPCETHDGVQTCFVKTGLRSATNTLAVLKTPNATSTIEIAPGCQIAGGITSANTFQFGWAATPYATTTNLGTMALAADGRGQIVATSSTLLFGAFGVGIDGVLPPNSFINLKIASGSVSVNFAPVGSCSIVYRIL